MNNILGKVNVGVSKLVGTCLISFFRCQSQHNGVTATEAQRRMPTPRRTLGSFGNFGSEIQTWESTSDDIKVVIN